MPTIVPATPDDFAAILGLLEDAGLPTAGVEPSKVRFFVATENGALVGCAGLEEYGDAALLRSVAVAKSARGTGVGRMLTAVCLSAAREAGRTSVSLLTETAADFFEKFGFERVDRSALPHALGESVELQHACPASAQAMNRALE